MRSVPFINSPFQHDVIPVVDIQKDNREGQGITREEGRETPGTQSEGEETGRIHSLLSTRIVQERKLE